MRSLHLFVAVFIAPVLCQAAPNFEGTWFTCLQGAPERVPYSLVDVVRDGDGYSAIHEWGVSYAQSAPGVFTSGRLVFKGCPTYKGQVVQDCNKQKPPVFFTITAAETMRKQTNIQTALKRSQRIKTNRSEWQTLAKQCTALHGRKLQATSER